MSGYFFVSCCGAEGRDATASFSRRLNFSFFF